MPINISVSEEIYKKLESLAIGFDTPERVIERLIEQYTSQDGAKEGKPRLSFSPSELVFKNELLVSKKAQIVIYTKDGERDVIHWNASRFQSSSNLRANLWSGCLRNWKEKNIVAAELSVLHRGTSSPGDDTELMITIAEELHWTLEEVETYFIGIDLSSSDDGVPYCYIASFSDETPERLKEIAGFDTSNHYILDLSVLPDEPDYDHDII